MENLDFLKLYCFLSFIIILLLWKFWKDFEFKNKYFAEVEKSNQNQNELLKEIEALSLEISDNSNKIDNLAGYLKRLDQNASRLADDIRGEQAMTKAIEMARKGQDHLDIIKATGLSNEEVEAIIHSHKDNQFS